MRLSAGGGLWEIPLSKAARLLITPMVAAATVIGAVMENRTANPGQFPADSHYGMSLATRHQ